MHLHFALYLAAFFIFHLLSSCVQDNFLVTSVNVCFLPESISHTLPTTVWVKRMLVESTLYVLDMHSSDVDNVKAHDSAR